MWGCIAILPWSYLMCLAIGCLSMEFVKKKFLKQDILTVVRLCGNGTHENLRHDSCQAILAGFGILLLMSLAMTSYLQPVDGRFHLP